MILTDHFVFIHVPKTGGTFVRSILADHVPKSWHVIMGEDHAPLSKLPASHAHLPVMGFVRNPYSWYVSWYHFQQELRDPYFVEVSENGTLPFGETMRRAFLTNESLLIGAGPFTQQLQHMFGTESEGVRFGRMETLRKDLLRIWSEFCEVPESVRAAIGDNDKANTSDHKHYRHYYDDDLRQLIREKDHVLFELFDYDWLKPY